MKKIVAAVFAILVLGCAGEGNQSTVAVTGVGTVLAQPDMIRIDIALSRIAPTTRQAQEEVNIQVAQVMELLKTENVEDKNISTSSLRFGQEYEWRTDRRELIGQKVEQIITFTVNDIRQDTEKVSRILDRMTEIENVALNQLNFSVKDNQEHFERSRELAYQKALDKANQYAGLSGLKVAKTLNVSEAGTAQILPANSYMMNQKMNSFAEAADGQSNSTMLPSGELEITTQISVVFLLK